MKPINIRGGRSRTNLWRWSGLAVNAIPNPDAFRRCYRWCVGFVTPLVYLIVEWGPWEAPER